MRGMGLIVYGVEGIGKTSFCLQFPKPLRCISVRESGYDDLNDIGAVPDGCENVYVDSFQDVLNEVQESTDVKTVVVDSLSGVCQFMKDAIIREVYARYDNPESAFGSFSEGWRIHGPTWIAKLENMATLTRNKGTNVLLVGHTRVEKGKNVIAADYQSAKLAMESWPREILTKWAQAVLFMQMDFQINVTKTWKGSPTEAKVVGDIGEEVDRIIYTTKHPSHDAKNRLNLTPFIQMGSSPEEAYQNFFEELPKPIQEHLGG